MTPMSSSAAKKTCHLFNMFNRAMKLLIFDKITNEPRPVGPRPGWLLAFGILEDLTQS
jgi:hypothetical protein